MDKKTFTIGVMSLSAVILFVANLLQPKFAEAGFVVRDNEYTAVTARISNGGEALYIVDNKTGKIAVLAYNPNRKQVEPLTPGTDLMKAFAPGKRP